MKTTNANFDTYHALDYKTPMYLVHFDGESTDYVNHTPGSPDNTCSKFLNSISGLLHTVEPEQGRATIGGVKAVIQDNGDAITTLLATDTYYFHRRKTTIKAGYMGMDEADMLTLFTGWVTGLKLSSDGLAYEFSITDPQKFMQRKIFRGAEDSTVTLSGNPINILLEVLTSTSGGANGDYDCRGEANGLGIDDDYINVTAIEAVRDNYFPGESNYMRFSITARQKGKDFIEKEILKPLRCYPVIDGDGKYSIKPFRPASFDEGDTVQSFDDDTIIGVPTLDFNLAATINEVEFHYDHDGSSTYDTILYSIDSTSVTNRGCGKASLVIKSKGLHDDYSPASITAKGTSVATVRNSNVLERFATPPLKITLKCLFSRWLSEAGDIVAVTSKLLPDVEAGTRGLTAERMEIINRQVDWKNGIVTVTLLDTNFDANQHCTVAQTEATVGNFYIAP